jgi:hypothetical protein
VSQTNVIILRIDAKRTKDFEALFEAEQYPHWREMHAAGQMLAASLTRVEFGSETDDAQESGYVNYIVVAKLTGMEAHNAHDTDPRFKAYDKKADAFQPEGPSVWGGETIFEIGGD